MKQNSSKGENSCKTVYYAGAGLAIGAAKRYGCISGIVSTPVRSDLTKGEPPCKLGV